METDRNLLIQYIIVGIILLAVAVWIVIKLIKLRRKGAVNACCGCSLADACNKKQQKQNHSAHSCKE